MRCVGAQPQDMIDRIPPPQLWAELCPKSRPKASRERGMTSESLQRKNEQF